MKNPIFFIIKNIVRYIFRVVFPAPPKPQPKISLLIPFSPNGCPYRKATLRWLLKYWSHELPDAEIVLGRSHSRVFCKGEALNNAARKATGKILVIIDADAYISGHILNRCADRILEEISYGHRLWYVPYRHLFRLTKKASQHILDSPPYCPLKLHCPPPLCDVESNGHKSKYGHRYGAMCMMFPREALEVLGCFDERFKGWGGEDVALLRALDTLYAKHKTTKNCIYHLWHPFIGEDYTTRKWKGQKHGGVNNDLANAYNRATRNPERMRRLVDAGCRASCK